MFNHRLKLKPCKDNYFYHHTYPLFYNLSLLIFLVVFLALQILVGLQLNIFLHL